MQILVNRVATEQQAKQAITARFSAFYPAGYISEDPRFQEDYFQGIFDFDLGYDSFSLEVQAILAKTMQGMDSELVPNESEIRIKPWFIQIKDRKLPQTILSSPRFRILTWGWRILPLVALSGAIFLGNLVFRPLLTGTEAEQARIAMIQFNSKAEAQDLLIRPHLGDDFLTLAERYSTHPQTKQNSGIIPGAIKIGNEIPGVGQVSGLSDCLKATREGAICDQILSANNKFYLIKILEKRDSMEVYGTQKQQFWIRLGLILCSGVTVVFAIKWWEQEQKCQLLKEVARKGADKQYLEDLLRRSREKDSKKALQWLHELLEKEISTLSFFIQFLKTGRIEDLFSIFCGAIVGGYLLSISRIIGGTSQVIWAKIYAVSLGMGTLTLCISAVLGTVKIGVVKQLFPEFTSLHPILLLSLIWVLAIFCLQNFLVSVLFLSLPKFFNYFYYLVITIYFIILGFSYFIGQDIGGILWLILFISFLLDIKFHWFRKLLDSLFFK